MKTIYKITILLGLSALVTSCHDNLKPNYQYMPNMYEPVSYNTYSESSAFKNGKEGQLPAEGSLNRGFEVYEYENSTAGYDLAKANLKSPLDTLSTEDMDKAKGLFEIYCAICHGNTGNGMGKLVTQGKLLGIPNYKDRVITTGSVFHVQTYGLNSMGAYSNQLNAHERWLVATYVMKLKSEL
jgi:mono/diheme cytochrome c family protein